MFLFTLFFATTYYFLAYSYVSSVTVYPKTASRFQHG